MKHLAVLIVLALFLIGVPSVVARGAPQPMHLYQNQVSTSWPLWGYLIEHQSNWQTMGCPQPSGNQPQDCDGYWVVNPHPESWIWNIDDTAVWRATGYLEAGESFSISYDTVVDWQRHQMYYISSTVGANKPFRVTVETSEWGASYSQDFEATSAFCIMVPYTSSADPRLMDIPGTNGGNGLGPLGRGFPTSIVFSITNTGARQSSKDSGFSVQSVYPNLSNQEAWCGGTNLSEAGGFTLVGP